MSILTDLKMWSKYRVTLQFTSPCIGGVPNAKNLIKGWLGTKNLATTEAELDELVNATAADLGGKVEEKASAMWTVFKRNEKGLYLEGRQVKAMFKESSNILRDMLIKAEAKGKTKERSRFSNLKSRVAERLYVEDDQIYFFRLQDLGVGNPDLTEPAKRQSVILKESDGSEERPIHVQTAQGPRTALKRTDFVLPGTRLAFTVKTLNDGVVDQELLAVLLEHSAENGLGADRSQGNGKFQVVEILPL